MKVLFIGGRPSRTNKDADVAFIGAKCEPRLRAWVKQLGLDWTNDCCFINRTDRQFKSMLIHATICNAKIVCLGNAAYGAVYSRPWHEFVNLPKVFKLPHPSSRNRQLNNPEFIEQKLKECREWLDEQQS